MKDCDSLYFSYIKYFSNHSFCPTIIAIILSKLPTRRVPFLTARNSNEARTSACSRSSVKPKNLYNVIHSPSSFLYYTAARFMRKSPIRKSSELATIRSSNCLFPSARSTRFSFLANRDPIEISAESLNHPPRSLVSIGVFLFPIFNSFASRYTPGYRRGSAAPPRKRHPVTEKGEATG